MDWALGLLASDLDVGRRCIGAAANCEASLELEQHQVFCSSTFCVPLLGACEALQIGYNRRHLSQHTQRVQVEIVPRIQKSAPREGRWSATLRLFGRAASLLSTNNHRPTGETLSQVPRMA
jgi:hypothetical protein